jgi:hypothetical protein
VRFHALHVDDRVRRGGAPETLDQPRALDRRELLRRGAITGSLVWTFPIIRSVRTLPAQSSGANALTCCTCNCSDENGLLVLQNCNPGISTSECEALCPEFCSGQGLFPLATSFVVCDTGTPTCEPTTLPGATGTACACG